MNKLTGVVIPMITPYTENDEIDIASLIRLTDYCIENEMDCLYPCGTTGEMMYLSLEERKLIAETVVKQAAGRVPVFIHVGAWNQDDTIELARHAVKINADGIGVVTPAFYKLSDQGLIDFYVTVAKSVPENFPVYMYAIPQNAVNDLNRYVCETVAGICPNVVGVKYSFADMTRMQELMTINNGGFDVHAGPDHLFTAFCSIGGKGTVSGNATCIPEHYAALWKAIKAGDYSLATKIQRRTNILNSVMCEENNICAYKVLLKHEGVISRTGMRKPLEELPPKKQAALIAKMEALDYKKVII